MLGGRLLDDEAEEAAEAVVAILLPLSLPLLLKPKAEVVKLLIKGFLNGPEGVGAVKEIIDVQSVLI
mgnify:FL=1